MSVKKGENNEKSRYVFEEQIEILGFVVMIISFAIVWIGIIDTLGFVLLCGEAVIFYVSIIVILDKLEEKKEESE